jgi:hypothetical protein
MGRSMSMLRTRLVRASIIVGLAFVMLLTSSCGLGGTAGPAGSGNVKTETRNVSGFDSVEFSSAGRLTIQQTGTDSLQIQADESVLPLLTSEVAGTTLRLGVKPGTNLAGAQNIAYTVTAKELDGIVLAGAGEVTITGVDGTDLSVAHNGFGKLSATGRVNRQVVNLTGAGQYEGRDLASQEAEVTVSGTGLAIVNASRTLVARVTGIGRIEYLGNPKVTQEVTGIGEVKRI